MANEVEFAQFRAKLIGDEGKNPNAGRDRLLKISEAERFQQLLHGEKSSFFWGMPLTDALKRGYQVTPRGIFESANQRATLDTAIRLSTLKNSANTNNSAITIVDAFVGTGQNLWAFAMLGFQVRGYEKDTFTFATIQNNIRLASLTDQARIINGDYFEQPVEFQEINALYLDPPWNGNYKYDLDKPFYFHDTTPPADQLVEKGFQTASIVMLKVPQNIDVPSIEDLSRRLGVSAHLDYQDTHPENMALSQATVYFQRGQGGVIVGRRMLYDQEKGTKVVNLNNEPFDIFIGRPSDWGNPFIIGIHGTRDEVIAKYDTYLAQNEKLQDKLHSLEGYRLGCFCKPEHCHGEILKEALKS